MLLSLDSRDLFLRQLVSGVREAFKQLTPEKNKAAGCAAKGLEVAGGLAGSERRTRRCDTESRRPRA